MPVNWLLETFKWQTLLKKIERLSLSKAVQGVLAGITVSIFTPNRIGEYGGRVLVVQRQNKWSAVLATIAGSLAQMVAIFLYGIIGMSYYFKNFSFSENPPNTTLLFSFVVALLSLVILAYFKIGWFKRIFVRIPYLKNAEKHAAILEKYEFKDLFWALFLAMLRLLVYSIQYYLLLSFFGSSVSLGTGMLIIGFVFLIQTVIPLPPIVNLFAKAGIALQVWSVIELNELVIISATFSLWAVNILVPSIIGMVFILKMNVIKSLGYED